MGLRCIGWSLLLCVATAGAQNRYVSDRTIVELRRGPSTEYLILRNLEAGQAVEVLEQNIEAGYSRVRVVGQGTEGWVLTRFLTAEPIARDRLAAAERNLAAARERTATLEAELATVTADLAAAQRSLAEANAARETVSRELADIRAAAANVVEIRDQNQSLHQKLIERDQAVEQLTAANEQLGARSAQNWFVIGAGVLLAGVVVGLVLPTLRRKRRSDW